VGVVWAFAVHTPKYGVVAWSAAYTTCSSGTGVITCRMWGGTPPARGWIGAFVIVVSVAMAVGTLGMRVETQSALGSIGGRKGSQAFSDIVRGPGTRNGDHDCGGGFSSSTVISSKLSGLPVRDNPVLKVVSSVAISTRDFEVGMPCTKTCDTRVSRRTLTVPGIKWRNDPTLLLSEVAFIDCIVVRVTVFPRMEIVCT